MIFVLMELIFSLSPGTSCVHSEKEKHQFGAINVPIYQSTTYVFDNCDQGGARFATPEGGYVYSRFANPTLDALNFKIAILEGTEVAVSFASGMGAIGSTLLTLLRAGDHVIAEDVLYGATYSYFDKHLRKFGVEVDFVDLTKPGAVESHLKPNTKLVYFETFCNPTVKTVDIKRVCDEAHKQPGVLTIIDNTFASPIICNPAKLGVDLVIHAATKFINGHSDVIAGLLCGPKAIVNEVAAFGLREMTGAVLSPHDAFLIIRGLMTLDLRIKAASENAIRLAKFLQQHPGIEKVYYPGLVGDAGYEISKKQLNVIDGKQYFGAMIAFEVRGGYDNAKKLCDSLHVISLAVSLGGCDSLIEMPASMTHIQIPREERIAAGLPDGLIRFSVGIESCDDLLQDLKQALDSLSINDI